MIQSRAKREVYPNTAKAYYRQFWYLIVFLKINELLGVYLEYINFAEQDLYLRFRADNTNDSITKFGYGSDRFVHLSTDLMASIDRYISSE